MSEWWEVAPVAQSQNWWEAAPKKALEWKDVPGEALSNLPQSAGHFVEALAQPFLHPIDTAKSLVSLADAVGSKISRPGDLLREGDAAPTPEQLQARQQREAPADAAADFFKDRYGGIENIKRTLASDPVGVAADAGTIFSGGAAAAPRASMLAGTLSKIGSAVDPISAVGSMLKAGGRVAEPVASNLLGLTTGTGTDTIRAAANAGREGNSIFTENLRGNAPITGGLDLAQSALEQMRQERGASYRSSMGEVAANTKPLDFAPIEEAAAKANKIGSYEGVTINRSAGDAVGKINALVEEWKSYPPETFHTAQGLDALKQAIGDVRDSTEFGTPARVAADRVYQAVKGEIEAKVPEYGKAMGDYAKASDQLKDVTKTFSLGEKASADTATRKLQSVMRNNVNTNYGGREKLMEVLAKFEPDLPATLAGQQMNSYTPRGLARGGPYATGLASAATANPMILGALLTQSPRLVGEGAYLAGRGVGAIERGAEAVGVNAKNVRAAEQGAYQGGRISEQEKLRDLARLLSRSSEQRQLRF